MRGGGIESGGHRKESPGNEGEVIWACDEKRGALRKLTRKEGYENENSSDKHRRCQDRCWGGGGHPADSTQP